MANVIGRFRKGKITLNVIRGEFNNKVTTSFTIKKRVLTADKEWKDSDFLSITDLQDILTLTERVCSDYVKYEKVEPKPKEIEQEVEEDTPF